MDYKYNGIILGKYDIGEIDRVYVVFTREAGKIKVLGKGVRKPNAKLAGNLEPITEAEIFVAKNKGMGKITSAIPLDNFIKIKSNVEFLEKVFYVFRIIEKIIPEQTKDERIFEFIESFLKTLENLKKNEKEKIEILSLGSLFKIIGELGYRLEMEKCSVCASRLIPENNYFSISHGGVLCGKCHPQETRKIKISGESIKLVRIFLKNRIENFIKISVSGKELNSLKSIIKETLNWIS